MSLINEIRGFGSRQWHYKMAPVTVQSYLIRKILTTVTLMKALDQRDETFSHDE